METISDFIEKVFDWASIPRFARYCIFVGLFLLGLLWVSDKIIPHQLWGQRTESDVFRLAVISILIGLIIIPLVDFFLLSLRTNDRQIYSVDKAFHTFYVVAFSGAIILFDHTKANSRVAYLVRDEDALKRLALLGSLRRVGVSYGEARLNDLEIPMPGGKKLKVNDYNYDYRLTVN